MEEEEEEEEGDEASETNSQEADSDLTLSSFQLTGL